MLDLYKLARPIVFQIDPENAHHMTLKALKSGIVCTGKTIESEKLEQTLFGLHCLSQNHRQEILVPAFSGILKARLLLTAWAFPTKACGRLDPIWKFF